MKKFSIKSLFTSFILLIAIYCGNFFDVKTSLAVQSIKSHGYDASFTTTLDKSKITTPELNSNLTATLPSQFDLRDYIDIEVEDQEGYSICYAFGSLTMLETHIALRYNEYYDFSEIHLASSKYMDGGQIVTKRVTSGGNTQTVIVDSNVDFDAVEGGGNFYHLYNYCMKNSGPVLEEEMPFKEFYPAYTGLTASECEDRAETYYSTYKNSFSKLVTVNQFVNFYNAKYLENQSQIIANRNNIKVHIKEYGSCAASVYSNSTFSYKGTEYMLTSSNTANHMISIIGWDDNYQPAGWANPGAYLCLNSYGNNNYGGVFYISYDDSNIESEVYGVKDLTLNSGNHVASSYENYLNNPENNKQATDYYSLNTNSSQEGFIATVTDVSKILNQEITEIDISTYFSSSTIPKIKLGFVNDITDIEDNGCLNSSDITSLSTLEIKSYSSPTYLTYEILNPNTNALETHNNFNGDSLYKVKLQNSIKVSGKYAIMLIQAKNMFRIGVINTPLNKDPLLNCYCAFDALNKIVPRLSDETYSFLPNTRFITSSILTGEAKNSIPTKNTNAISKGECLEISISDVSKININNIEVYSVSSTNTSYTKNFVTNKFNITKDENSLNLLLTNLINTGRYLVKIETIDNKLYYKSFLVNASANLPPEIVKQPEHITTIYDGEYHILTCTASHYTNSISYQWYKDDKLITDATSNQLKLISVADSGLYHCVVTADGINLTSNPANVIISKADYDLNWDYSTTFNYDNNYKTVKVINNYKDLTIVYSNNQQVNAGRYIAKAEVKNYDNINYNKPVIDNLIWEINKAEITIKIKDCTVKNQEELESFKNYSHSIIGNIYDAYIPELEYFLVNTDDANIKVIDANYTKPNNYNITLKTGLLYIAKQNLSYEFDATKISVYSELGYLTSAKLVVKEEEKENLSEDNLKFLKDNSLSICNIYNISVPENPVNTDNKITISLSGEMSKKNLMVYLISEDGPKLLESKIENGSLTFDSSQFGSFMLVEKKEKSSILPIIISLSVVLAGTLCCCIIITSIKRHRNKKYNYEIDYTPH